MLLWLLSIKMETLNQIIYKGDDIMKNKKNKCPKCGSEKFLGIKYLVEERYYNVNENGVIDYSNDPFIEYEYIEESPMFVKCQKCNQMYYTEKVKEYGSVYNIVYNINLNKPVSKEELEKYLYI